MNLRRLRWLSASALVCVGLITVLSWGLAAYLPVPGRQAPTVALMQSVFPWMTPWPVFATMPVRAAAYFLPITLATVITGALCLTLRHETATPAQTDLLLRRALWIAPISMVALPLFTKDLWLSIGWGRMVAHGMNPYSADISPAAINGLPVTLRHFTTRMTYGPLWAALSGIMAWLARGNVWADFLLAKGLLAAAWVGGLFALRAAGRHRSEYHAAMAVVLWGYLPLGWRLGIAEGHNGVVLAAALSLWCWALLDQREALRPVALALSVLTKYVTAPVAVLDLLALRNKRYLLGAVGAGLASAVLVAIFLRDPGALDSTREMQNWDWWTPGLALVDAAGLAGVYLPRLPVQAMMMGLGGLAVAVACRHARRHPLDLLNAAITVQLVILLLLVGHVWPWFVLWVFAPATLLWDRSSGKVALSLALTAPILNVAWIVDPIALGRTGGMRVPPDVLFYGAATMTLLALVWLLKPSGESAREHTAQRGH